MNPRTSSALVFALMVFTAAPASAEGWLCVAEKSTGFKFVQGQGWDYARFTADQKYLITHPGKENHFLPNTFWTVTEIGDEHPSFFCNHDFDDKDFLNCQMFREFVFNRNTLRYTIVQTLGFVDESENKSDAMSTPYVEIGKCSPL